MVTEII